MAITKLLLRYGSLTDEMIKDFSSDYPDDASLVFRISGIEDSILFTGDVHTAEMGEYLLREHAALLQARYLQVNDHGDSEFDQYFYDVVAPKIAICDVPEDELNESLSEYLHAKDIDIYSFATAPNRFAFK